MELVAKVAVMKGQPRKPKSEVVMSVGVCDLLVLARQILQTY